MDANIKVHGLPREISAMSHRRLVLALACFGAAVSTPPICNALPVPLRTFDKTTGSAQVPVVSAPFPDVTGTRGKFVYYCTNAPDVLNVVDFILTPSQTYLDQNTAQPIFPSQTAELRARNTNNNGKIVDFFAKTSPGNPTTCYGRVDYPL